MTIFDQAQEAWDEVNSLIEFQYRLNTAGIVDPNGDWEIELYSSYALMADDIINSGYSPIKNF